MGILKKIMQKQAVIMQAIWADMEVQYIIMKVKYPKL